MARRWFIDTKKISTTRRGHSVKSCSLSFGPGIYTSKCFNSTASDIRCLSVFVFDNLLLLVLILINNETEEGGGGEGFGV